MKTIDKKSLGELIRLCRVYEKGWSKEDLGDKTGRAENTVWYWERGEFMPSEEVLEKMNELFETTFPVRKDFSEGKAKFLFQEPFQLSEEVAQVEEKLENCTEHKGPFKYLRVYFEKDEAGIYECQECNEKCYQEWYDEF